jgi:hypothetical protein
LSEFLQEDPAARANFLRLAKHVWPRHLRDLADELRRLELDAAKKP